MDRFIKRRANRTLFAVRHPRQHWRTLGNAGKIGTTVTWCCMALSTAALAYVVLVTSVTGSGSATAPITSTCSSNSANTNGCQTKIENVDVEPVFCQLPLSGSDPAGNCGIDASTVPAPDGSGNIAMPTAPSPCTFQPSAGVGDNADDCELAVWVYNANPDPVTVDSISVNGPGDGFTTSNAGCLASWFDGTWTNGQSFSSDGTFNLDGVGSDPNPQKIGANSGTWLDLESNAPSVYLLAGTGPGGGVDQDACLGGTVTLTASVA